MTPRPAAVPNPSLHPPPPPSDLLTRLAGAAEVDPSAYERAALTALPDSPEQALVLAVLAVSSRLEDILSELDEGYVQRTEQNDLWARLASALLNPDQARDWLQKSRRPDLSD